ncbi:MAG: alkaline phosphatase D family protein [Myxococcota bacterium]
MIHRRFLLIPLCLGALACGGPDALEDNGAALRGAVSLGPMIGQLRPGSARIWVRTATAARVYATVTGPTGSVKTAAVETAFAHDYTATLAVPNLSPSTSYRYTLTVDGAVVPGSHSFVTAPPETDAPSFSFVVLSDFRKGACPTLATAAALDPAFVLMIGDLDHRGPGAGDDPQVWLDAMRTMRRELRDPTATQFGATFSQGLLERGSKPQLPLYYVWDDHDYCLNNSDQTCPARSTAFRVYGEYFLTAKNHGTNGVYQSFRYGKHLEIFMLDARSNRQEIGPGASMLGAEQLAWLEQGLAASTATWKLIMSPVPFNPATKTYDAWGAFPEERSALLRFIQDTPISGVVIVSGDIHSGGAVDSGAHSGLPEISVPHANMPSDWVDTYQHEPGTWSLGQGRNTAPLLGGNNPGFVKVDLVGPSLKISVLGADGRTKTTLDGRDPLVFQR